MAKKEIKSNKLNDVNGGVAVIITKDAQGQIVDGIDSSEVGLIVESPKLDIEKDIPSGARFSNPLDETVKGNPFTKKSNEHKAPKRNFK